ncbi:MAG: hypothetical protein H6628_03995 [Calditrichae bacterium]|nr:hypothetical protein [Calditrichia bacterium]
MPLCCLLTAFGNTTSSAYLRLVPNQEAPTHICWSDLNRSALIRVPWPGTAPKTWRKPSIPSSTRPIARQAASKPWNCAVPTAAQSCISCWPGSPWRQNGASMAKKVWRLPKSYMSPAIFSKMRHC